jgi:two-component system LytT family response regulator
MTHRVLIVDDEPLARRGVRARLRRHPDFVVVRECGDGETAVEAIRGLRPDLVFLDVEMPGMSGLDVVQAVGEGRMPATVFTTAYARYAVDAFGAAAVDYLLKPLDPDRFERALARARWTLAARSTSGGASLARPDPPLERFWVKTRTRVVLVAVDDVDWIQAEGDYARLHVGAQSYLVPDSLAGLEVRLPGTAFVRIHRSTIVNVRRIAGLVPAGNLDHRVHLVGGVELRLSRTYYRRLSGLLRPPMRPTP